MLYERPIPRDLEGILDIEEIRGLQDAFLDESVEELERGMRHLIGPESMEEGAGMMHQLFRAVHSLKGSASVFGYDDLSRLSHQVEHLLSPYRQLPSKEMFDRRDEILNLIEILLTLVRDGKQDCMDCLAAEADIRQWSTSSSVHTYTPPTVAAPARAESVGQARQEDARPRSSSPAPVPQLALPVRALMADSSRTFPRLIQRVLTPLDIHCVDCANGVDVIEQCAIQVPPLLLLGYVLPDMDGGELLRLLHEAGLLPPVVVLVSAREEREMRDLIPFPFIFVHKDHMMADAIASVMRSLIGSR